MRSPIRLPSITSAPVAPQGIVTLHKPCWRHPAGRYSRSRRGQARIAAWQPPSPNRSPGQPRGAGSEASGQQPTTGPGVNRGLCFHPPYACRPSYSHHAGLCSRTTQERQRAACPSLPLLEMSASILETRHRPPAQPSAAGNPVAAPAPSSAAGESQRWRRRGEGTP